MLDLVLVLREQLGKIVGEEVQRALFKIPYAVVRVDQPKAEYCLQRLVKRNPVIELLIYL